MSELITGVQYAYHSTQNKYIDSIMKNGIKSQKKNADSEIIINVLKEKGHENTFPFSRNDVNYCHTDKKYIKSRLNQKLFGQNYAVVIINLNKINHPMYIADMSMITNLIDYKCIGNKALNNVENVEKAIELYNESIYKINSLEDIEEYNKNIEGHMELVIDGDISPSAIVNTIRTD